VSLDDLPVCHKVTRRLHSEEAKEAYEEAVESWWSLQLRADATSSSPSAIIKVGDRQQFFITPLLYLYVNLVTDQLLANYNALTSHSSVWIFLGVLTPLVLKLICTFSEIPVFKSKKLDTPPM
jgi:hypothetical protein